MSSQKMKRQLCGELRSCNSGERVRLCGWVAHRRDHGGLVFIDLRDESGMIQVVVDPDNARAFGIAEEVRHEWVLEIVGDIATRPDGTENPSIPTGEIEVRADQVAVLARAETTPFVIDDRVEVDEALRLRYRYLDLRRPRMLARLKARARALSAMRKAMEEAGLVEIETPTLTRATPEGARDYLVPSRRHLGSAYALAQSPQLYKQLLMVAGVGSYYQITRCWRDEDLRADRQPEFTQLDLELAFAGAEEVMEIVEAAICAAATAIRGTGPVRPFPRIAWAEAMARYGTDKPDLRIEGELVDLTSALSNTKFRAFGAAVEQGGSILGLKVTRYPRDAGRSWYDSLVDRAISMGARGLVWMVAQQGGELKSPVSKFLGASERKAILERLDLRQGDLALLMADKIAVAREILGRLRSDLALNEGNLISTAESEFQPFWVVDFPLVEWNEEEQRLDPLHHPFCAPHPDDLEIVRAGPDAIIAVGPENVRALAYDLVVDGWELGSGSVRIHTRDLQEIAFNAIGIAKDEAAEKFGFLLEAFRFGAPPHAGFAFGVDRLISVLMGEASIREVIAFPKTQSGAELMTGSPAPLDQQQLSTLGLALRRTRQD